MWLSIPSLLAGAIVVLLTKHFLDRKRRQECFAVQNIPGPKPSFLWGNFGEFRCGSSVVLMEWWKKYGKTFCYFEGDRPILVTSDLDIMKHVLIKDFSNFHSRAFSFFFTPDEGLVHAKGETWKRLRRIISPTFSACRMKEMSPLLNHCVDGLLDVLDQRAKDAKSFNIMTDFQGLTLTAIASCGFGMEIDALKEPDNIFLAKCREAFDFSSIKRPFYFMLVAAVGLLFPRFTPVIRYAMPNLMGIKNEWLCNATAAIIESRRNDKEKRNDFIQLMLDAEQHDEPENEDLLSLEVNTNDDDTTEATIIVEDSAKRAVGRVSNGKIKGKSMTLREIQAQCMTFLLAGYETTSTALSFAIYELAMHVDIQAKLQQEIDEHFSGDKTFDYLSVQKMPYMDMVFSETLRLHSIAGVVTIRECVHDWQINGLRIPQGAIIKIHMEAVHKSLEHWGPEDTDDFVPERFLAQRKAARNPLAWQPFGGGPRNCLGMRFALMEAKITLARVLQRFNISRTDETQVPLKIASHGIMRPSQGVFVKLCKRDANDF